MNAQFQRVHILHADVDVVQVGLPLDRRRRNPEQLVVAIHFECLRTAGLLYG